MKNRLSLNNNIIGKSSGLSLYSHTQHLFDGISKILSDNPFIFNKYKDFFNLNDEQLKTHLSYIISYHDYGKSHARWQEFAKKNCLINVELRHEIIYIFQIIEIIVKENLDKNHLNNIRDYLKYFDKIFFIIIPILAHHSNLSISKKEKINKTFYYLEDKYKKILGGKSLFDFLNLLFNEIDSDIYTWYRQAMYRYLLQLCDKRASILENNINIILPKFNKFNFDDKKYTNLRFLQTIVKNIDNPITILRANTGGGKTLASIIWGNEQIKKGYADRIVIAMPTQFTSNALAGSVSKYVNDVNIQHGNSKINYDEHRYKWVRTLQSSVTVCTIDHLLIAMSLCNEENQHTLFNLINGCLVIDEADFYDNFIQANIFELINFLLKLNVRILIMSATLPDRFVDMLSNSINIKDLKILEGTQIEESKRLKVDIKRITKKFNYKKIKNKKTCIIYCNTIKRAIDAYHNLIKLGVDEKRLVLYHSSFKEEDKINIEKNIIEKLGEDAWKNGVADGIVIMTQIGELSINISSDYIITDICPIDRLVQRFGRGSRFDTNLCVVDVIIPTKNNLLYPAPYGNYNRKDGWNENIYLKRTRKHLKKGLYSYDDFITIINKVYDDMILEEKSIENALLLRKMNKTNIFFNKGVKLDDEFNDVDWVARDINNQAKVYVGIPNNYYESYDKYNLDFKNKSVSVPLYKYQNLLKNNIIEYFEILIKNKKENIYVLNETYYSDVFGFIG